MNSTQHALAREHFKTWVETTDVAEQCGLTREEMIESAEFSISPRPPQFIIKGGEGGTAPGERGGDVHVTFVAPLDAMESLKVKINGDIEGEPNGQA